MTNKSTLVITIKSRKDFDTLLDKLSVQLWHSLTASEHRKFPNKLKSTNEPDKHAALHYSAENESLFYIKELKIPVE